jgi:chemotaxis-related protein WspD
MDAIAAIDGCWKKIGVRGDSSCALLREHVHCRNCPVYSEAAVRLLDGELPDDDLRHRTRSVARAEHLEACGTHSIVVFRIAAEWLALPTTVFQEIASVRVIRSVPHRRNGVILGLANVRGELIVCASLHYVLGIEPDAVASERGRFEKRGPDARFLVLRFDDHRVACPVDEVHGVERIRNDHLEALPDTVGRAATSYTRAVLEWRDRSLNVLDAKRLFHTFDRSMSSVKTI